MITVNMISALKVQFIKPIFEDDFVEKGMIAWLTDIEWDAKTDCYQLYFDFKEFEEYNEKYFKESFYPNIHTASLTQEQLRGRNGSPLSGNRDMFTAKEAGQYSPKYSVYLSIESDVRDDEKFAVEIKKYLREV